VIEVNRSEEIDALIAALTSMLKETKYPMEGKRVVWAMNDRIYRSGTEFYIIPKEEWEASPFANVHKFSHDVYPANAALGINGCSDCHGSESPFFFASVMQYPFDEKAAPVTMSQHRIMSISGLQATLGVWRETYLKSILNFLLIIFGCALIGWGYQALVEKQGDQLPPWLRWRYLPVVIGVGALVAAIILLSQGELAKYSLPSRFWLDANHFFISMIVLGISFVTLAFCGYKKNWLLTVFFIAAISGGIMLIKLPWISVINRLSYTVFDLSLVILTIGMIWFALQKISFEQRK
jgi:hypothetical protein